jgi:hypothetical protein
LPPPLKSFAFAERGGRVELKLDPAWRELQCGGYIQKVPLPLPRTAAAQNVVLLLLVSAVNDTSSDGAEITFRRKLRRFCHALGLDHRRRNRVLEHALASACAWFKQQGGELEPVTKDGKIIFIMQRPKRRKPPEQKPIVKRKPLPVLTPAPRRELPYLQQFLAKLDKHEQHSSMRNVGSSAQTA